MNSVYVYRKRKCIFRLNKLQIHIYVIVKIEIRKCKSMNKKRSLIKIKTKQVLQLKSVYSIACLKYIYIYIHVGNIFVT